MTLNNSSGVSLTPRKLKQLVKSYLYRKKLAETLESLQLELLAAIQESPAGIRRNFIPMELMISYCSAISSCSFSALGASPPNPADTRTISAASMPSAKTLFPMTSSY